MEPTHPLREQEGKRNLQVDDIITLLHGCKSHANGKDGEGGQWLLQLNVS